MVSGIMMMKRYIELYAKTIFFKKPLKAIDEFYNNIILQLPDNEKISYCESLVFRAQEDSKQCTCKLKRLRLKQLLRASTLELKRLEKLNRLL